ncbi:MAG: histidine kinase [Candidatus Eremiobacteraeota bacterium]|nr:histidine kinase [Candidatus Eremiobacteraeota bacterium]
MTKQSHSSGDPSGVPLVDLLEFAIEQANDGIAIMRFTGDVNVPIRIVYANEAIERLSGYSREELLDPSNPFLQVQPQNRAVYEAHFVEIRAGRPVRFEVELGGKDRSTWMDIRWSPLRYGAGEVTQYVAVLRDITERRRNEAQLTLLQSILSETSDFIVIADATGPVEGGPKVTYANPAFAGLVGLRPDRVVGRGLTGFFSPRNDEKLVAGVISRFERHQSIANELLLRRVDDGNDVWIELIGHHVRGEGGRPVSWFLIGKDISVRKQSYAQTVQLMTALDLAEEPIAIYGVIKPHELEMQHMNERATAFDRLLFENVLLDPSQRDWIESIWPALESGRSVSRLVRAAENDSRRWVTLEIRPLGTGTGSLTSIIAIEHGLRFAMADGQNDDVGTALALSREILRYADLAARRDAFLEVLREEWFATGSFRFTEHLADVAFRVKERNGVAVMPGGVLFERPTAVDFSWSGDNPPRRLIALRLFLETLANAD